MAGSIRMEAEYAHAPERVWAALTSTEAIARWLMPNDFEPRIGHRFQFRVANARGWSGVVDCEVIELQPPRRLAYTWKSDKVDTVLTWTLHPTAKGTRLELVHSGFKGVGQLVLRKLILGPGWRRMLDGSLPNALAGLPGAGEPIGAASRAAGGARNR